MPNRSRKKRPRPGLQERPSDAVEALADIVRRFEIRRFEAEARAAMARLTP
jgi:hypothetical protein